MSTREHRPSATQVRTILQNGLVLGINDSVWVYRQVPMETIADARTEEDRLAAATPLYRALNEVSKLVPGGIGRRSVAKSNYRQVHLLAVNIPALFTPKPDSKLRDKHADMYPNMVTSKRVCLMGVRLVDSIGKGGSSLRETVNTVAEVLLSGSVPLEDFALDHRRIDQILARCGLATPDPETMRLADGWWNFGSAADIPVLPAPETMHFFTSSEAAAVVEKVGINNRADWPEVLPGHHSVTFASLADLELHYESASSDFALWVSKMYESNAAVVSIRGAVEPRKITQKEVRRRRRTYLADIEERVKNNKMNRQEQDERFQELGQVEAIYADDGAPPTMIETSVIVGFDGEVTDMKEITDGSPAVLHIMQNRQYEAWAETMIASGVRANPHIHDIPSHVIASSGINSLSVVGDEDGAILGFTELDSQVAYIDPSAASEEDELPIMLCAAGTGSGKAALLTTLVPTPSGWTTIGALTCGDTVIGRNGKPTTVTHLSPIREADTYTIRFSDGQEVVADFDHQWVVSSHHDRNKFRDTDRQNAIRNWEAAHADVALLRQAAEEADPQAEVRIGELLEAVRAVGMSDSDRWSTQDSLYSALHMMDAPFRTVAQEVNVTSAVPGRRITKTDPSKLFDLHAGLEVLIDSWRNLDPRNAARWGKQAAARIRAAEAVKAKEATRLITASRLIDLIEAEGASLPKSPWRSRILSYMREAGVEVIDGHAEVTIDLPESHTRTREVSLYPLASTLHLLAERLRQQYANKPKNSHDERRMTTGEIIAASEGKTQKYAIHVPEPIDLPEADLPVAPYTFGAWLGDGFTGQPHVVSDDPQIIEEIVAEGYEILSQRLCDAAKSEITTVYTFDAHLRDGLNALELRTRHVRGERIVPEKHIPMLYQRASISQRLAVLQGLMDTDGTIDEKGSCELSLSCRQLAKDALSLIRSLGIKASMNTTEAGYRNADGEYVACKDRHRIHFTTTQPVFRLERKAKRLPETVRESNNWLYIESITKGEPAQMRCLTVADEDATYLVEDFIPTSNTVMALHLADQFVDNGNPVIIIDPKALPLDAEILTPDTESGTITMRDITEGTRVFDRRGKVCTVTLKSRVFTTDETRMFEIVTDDGQVTRADANHMWPVLDPAGRKKAVQDPDADLGPLIRELTTQQILDEGVEVSGQSRFALPVAGAVEHDEADLPISPYLLGAWLGDGTSKGGEIVCGERDLEEMTRLIEAEWGGGITTYRPRNRAPSIRMTRREDECYYGHADFVEVNRGDRLAARCRTCEVQAQRRARRGLVGGRGARVNPSLTHLLRDAGVLNSKHIPHAYMTASTSQRLALLQGIMDTDGTVKRRGDLRVSLADEGLARDVLGLVRSLGIKASIWSGSSRLGDYVGEQHVVTFRTDKPVFRLSRKAGLQPKVTPVRSRFLYITEIREVEPVEAQCIRVDSPDHTYQIAGNIVTHNTGSDHSPAVMATGKGHVYKLDDLAQADGIFDPISFSADASVGVQLSVTMLMQIAPWGAAGPEFETQLTTALAYGTSRGAGCIGEALRIAVEDKRLDPIIAQPIFELAEASTTFRACAGMSSSGERLRVSEGINLIMVGDYALDLPAPGLPPESQQQRVAMALVRMMVFGSAMALTNRKGVIFLDEAWIFLQSGASEVIKLGRLARSQRVFPVLLTQRVSDALGAGLEDFISRTLIGAIENNHEAYAACKMAKLDPTPERIARITASATIGQAGKKVPNWQSMKALRNKETRETYRGAIYIYSDLAKRAVPVEVKIPESKLEISSTNPIDINRRRAKEGLPPLEFTSDSESDET